MRKIIFVAILLSLLACNNNEQPPIKQPEKVKLNYNPETDKLINDALNTKPLFIKWGNDVMIIRYSNIQLTVWHDKAIPFERKDEWNFHCDDINGNMILLQSYNNLPENKISEATLNRIKDMYNQKHK